MSVVIAIDPGTEQSGYCVYGRGKVFGAGILENKHVIAGLTLGIDFAKGIYADTLAIEMVASYGMPVGREVFETVRWIGRFQQAWGAPEEVRLVYRRDVKLHLCGSMKAKDPNVRQALIDKLGPVGTKKNPGPLYGVTSHAWSALAIAVTVSEMK